MSDSDAFDDFVFDPVLTLGVWANGTRVLRGRDEFVVDFLRRIPEHSGLVLVARALVPPVAAIELRDQLDEAWRGYSDWSMPDVDDG